MDGKMKVDETDYPAWEGSKTSAVTLDNGIIVTRHHIPGDAVRKLELSMPVDDLPASRRLAMAGEILRDQASQNGIFQLCVAAPNNIAKDGADIFAGYPLDPSCEG